MHFPRMLAAHRAVASRPDGEERPVKLSSGADNEPFFTSLNGGRRGHHRPRPFCPRLLPLEASIFVCREPLRDY